MPPPILLDTTRLLTRLQHAAPTGIDRVDLAYARHFLRGHYSGQATAATPFGMRLLPDAQLAQLFATIERRWADQDPVSPDPVLAGVAAWLNGQPRAAKRTGRSNGLSRLRLPVAALRHAAALRWQEAVSSPRDAIYLHTSHLRLDRPALFDWLADRPDIRSIFFVHDIIPIEYPEFGVPGEAARHQIRMATVSRHAAAVVVSSHAVQDTLTRYLAAQSLRVPPITVAPIGVESIFEAPGGTALSAARPYFVVCSTIETRKNHLLLLQVWRELAAQLGADTPALIIVGRRGWESENVIDMLERCPAMHDHVVEAPGLSTPGLVSLLRGARALLMPSFAEGYGIPVVEALSLGVPVIASDLPVHREIAGPHARFHAPLDGLGWRDAILAANDPKPTGVTGFKAPRWSDHFVAVDRLVAGL
jgi:glycosyltransferase involved in cell wall biosynthesis